MAKPAGWRREPARHALAAKGVRTKRAGSANPISKSMDAPSLHSQAWILARRTQDAYSFGMYYDLEGWADISEYLLGLGFSERATEGILRSKHMRWAYDTEGKTDEYLTPTQFKKYFKKNWEKISVMLHQDLEIDVDEIPLPEP